MRSYGAARFFCSVLSFLSWCVIIVGLFVMIGGLGFGSQMGGFGSSARSGGAVLGALPGLGMVLIGFLCLVISQSSRAGVDCAEYAQQGLKIARDQLDVSQQALKQSKTLEGSFAALQAGAPAPQGASFEKRITGAEALGLKQSAETEDLAILEPTTPTPGPMVIEHRSKEIHAIDGHYQMGAMTFDSLDQAKSYAEAIERGSRSGDKEATSAKEPSLVLGG